MRFQAMQTQGGNKHVTCWLMAGANIQLDEFSFIVTALESKLSPLTLYF